MQLKWIILYRLFSTKNISSVGFYHLSDVDICECIMDGRAVFIFSVFGLSSPFGHKEVKVTSDIIISSRVWMNSIGIFGFCLFLGWNAQLSPKWSWTALVGVPRAAAAAWDYFVPLLRGLFLLLMLSRCFLFVRDFSLVFFASSSINASSKIGILRWYHRNSLIHQAM